MSDVHDLVLLRSALCSVISQSDQYRRRSGERLARQWDLAVEKTLLFICQFPLASRVVLTNARSAIQIRSHVIRGFPRHFILYHIEKQDVIVVLVIHGARDLAQALGQAQLSEDEE